jgi:hypothetical protein
MNETRETPTGAPAADCICGTIRKLADEVVAALRPNPKVTDHFREARVQILLGVRQLIDDRIDHLHRTDSKGSRVVVE